MKKNKKFSTKLSLNKETITNLNEIKGGGDDDGAKTILTICKSCNPDNCVQPGPGTIREPECWSINTNCAHCS